MKKIIPSVEGLGIQGSSLPLQGFSLKAGGNVLPSIIGPKSKTLPKVPKVLSKK
jgi:hypothetical protein